MTNDYERRIERLEQWQRSLRDGLSSIVSKIHGRLTDHERRLDAAELHGYTQDTRITDLEAWRRGQEALLKGTGPLARAYDKNDWIVFHELLTRYFDLDEFADLCFRLGISPDEIPGTKLTTRCRELVLMCQRTLRADDLIVQAKKLRPNVQWP